MDACRESERHTWCYILTHLGGRDPTSFRGLYDFGRLMVPFFEWRDRYLGDLVNLTISRWVTAGREGWRLRFVKVFVNF